MVWLERYSFQSGFYPRYRQLAGKLPQLALSGPRNSCSYTWGCSRTCVKGGGMPDVDFLASRLNNKLNRQDS